MPDASYGKNAVGALSGFWFQFRVTVLRWLRLEANQTMLVEVIEDVAIESPDELLVDQVKSSKAPVTLRSEQIRKTLARFLREFVRNVDRKTTYQLTIRGTPGIERPAFAGLTTSAIVAWWEREDQCAVDLPEWLASYLRELIDDVSELTDSQLMEFVDSVRWVFDSPQLTPGASVEDQITAALAARGVSDVGDAERKLIAHAFQVATRDDPAQRQLSLADLDRFLEPERLRNDLFSALSYSFRQETSVSQILDDEDQPIGAALGMRQLLWDHLDAARPEAARDVLVRAVTSSVRSDERAYLSFLLAVLEKWDGNASKALERVDAAIASDCLPRYQALKGLILKDLGQTDIAVSLLRPVFENCDKPIVAGVFAELLRDQGSLKEAIRVLEDPRHQAHTRNSADCLFHLAECRFLSGDADGAYNALVNAEAVDNAGIGTRLLGSVLRGSIAEVNADYRLAKEARVRLVKAIRELRIDHEVCPVRFSELCDTLLSSYATCLAFLERPTSARSVLRARVLERPSKELVIAYCLVLEASGRRNEIPALEDELRVRHNWTDESFGYYRAIVDATDEGRTRSFADTLLHLEAATIDRPRKDLLKSYVLMSQGKHDESLALLFALLRDETVHLFAKRMAFENLIRSLYISGRYATLADSVFEFRRNRLSWKCASLFVASVYEIRAAPARYDVEPDLITFYRQAMEVGLLSLSTQLIMPFDAALSTYRQSLSVLRAFLSDEEAASMLSAYPAESNIVERARSLALDEFRNGVFRARPLRIQLVNG